MILVASAAASDDLQYDDVRYPLYPATLTECPALPSPLEMPDDREYVVVTLYDGAFAIVDVSRADHPEQLRVDRSDFPVLARDGLHDRDGWSAIKTINGRSTDDITDLARPGGLSSSRFLAADENVLSVLRGDDDVVRGMGLTHPELARPLFHVWNLMQTDIELGRWNMREHRWDNMTGMKYNDGWVLLEAHDTKGGQESPFADGLTGAFWIVLRRSLSKAEEEYLHAEYHSLDPERWDTLHGTLTRIFTGEMEPHYIMWYGFYEGHTAWRADPVGIARIFGLRTLGELEAAFPAQLDRVTCAHHTEAGGPLPSSAPR
jgi:hypothetical protein